MPKELPQTFSDMGRKAIVTDKEIVEAIEAYLADPKAAPFEFTSGHTLDVGMAVETNKQAMTAMAQKGTNDAFWRTMIRTAVILATPLAK